MEAVDIWILRGSNMIWKTRGRVSMTRESTAIRTVNEYDDNDISLSTIHIYIASTL